MTPRTYPGLIVATSLLSFHLLRHIVFVSVVVSALLRIVIKAKVRLTKATVRAKSKGGGNPFCGDGNQLRSCNYKLAWANSSKGHITGGGGGGGVGYFNKKPG